MDISITPVDSNGISMININEHNIEMSGRESSGYCYTHQSFDCELNLTKEEKEAIKNYR